MQLSKNTPCVLCPTLNRSASFDVTGCTIVVYSVLLANALTNAKVHPSIPDPGTCYVMFTNVALRRTYDWHVIPTPLSENLGNRRNVKLFKMLAPASTFGRHRGPTLYVDNKIRLTRPPSTFVRRMLNGSAVAGFAHPYVRNSLEEAGHIARMKRHDARGRTHHGITESADMIDVQRKYYFKTAKRLGFLARLTKTGIFDTALLAIDTSHAAAYPFLCRWLNQISLFSDRDQVALSWVRFFLNGHHPNSIRLLPERGALCSFWVRRACAPNASKVARQHYHHTF